jgi:hypothetical protein
MDQDSRTFVGTVMEEGQYARVVKILVTDVIADVDAEVPGTHAAREFSAGSVDVLQWNLAEGLQFSIRAIAQLQRGIIEELGAFKRVLGGPLVSEENRCR